MRYYNVYPMFHTASVYDGSRRDFGDSRWPFILARAPYLGAQRNGTDYLPSGTDWYNFWTNERLKGGQTITASAPIDTIPLFVRAGSILPLGTPILSTDDKQELEKIRVYPGANGDLALHSDDGKPMTTKREIPVSPTCTRTTRQGS